MTNDQLFNLCSQGYFGGLGRRTVLGLDGFVQVLMKECRFMIQQVNISNLINHGFIPGRVGTIGIGQGRARWKREILVSIQEVSLVIENIGSGF